MLGFSMSLSLPKVDVIDHAQFLLFICNMTSYSELRCYSSQSNLSLQTPLKYGHLSITDSSFGPRNAKNHTFPTSIIQTPL